jgi:Ca2+-binding EF-hand superfamily protein
MTRIFVIFLTALALAALACPVMAGSKTKHTFDSVDKNNDGKIDMGEWLQAWVDKEAAKKKFHKLDRNKDGVLDDADGRILFKERDKDGNNKISRDEYVFDSSDAQRDRDAFVDYDSNRDFNLTYDEWGSNWPFMPYWD